MTRAQTTQNDVQEVIIPRYLLGHWVRFVSRGIGYRVYIPKDLYSTPDQIKLFVRKQYGLPRFTHLHLLAVMNY